MDSVSGVAPSVTGLVAFGGTQMTFDYSTRTNQLIVGRPAENIVSLFDELHCSAVDEGFCDGFDR